MKKKWVKDSESGAVGIFTVAQIQDLKRIQATARTGVDILQKAQEEEVAFWQAARKTYGLITGQRYMANWETREIIPLWPDGNSIQITYTRR